MTTISSPAPPTQPSTPAVPTRPLTLASWLLRIGIALHAAALFLIVFSARQTQFGNVLFLEWFVHLEDPHATAVLVEKITVSLYLAAGLVVLVKPFWPVLLLMAAYAFIEAASGTFNAGFRFSEWTIPAQALRFGLPLVLLIVVVAPRFRLLQRWTAPMAASLLRVLVAVVFFTHGYLALMENPRFIDLIIGSFGNILNMWVNEATAVMMLKVIAIVDFCVALAVLIYPTPILVPRKLWASPCRICAIRRVIVPLLMLWLAFWGLLTALSRMASLGYTEGMSEYLELLVRSPHVLGPLALWALFSATYRPWACGVVGRERLSTGERQTHNEAPARDVTATSPKSPEPAVTPSS